MSRIWSQKSAELTIWLKENKNKESVHYSAHSAVQSSLAVQMVQ